MDLGKVNWKTSGNNSNILDVIKNTHDSWEEVNLSTLLEIWKVLISILIGDFERLNTSVDEAIADVVERAK